MKEVPPSTRARTTGSTNKRGRARRHARRPAELREISLDQIDTSRKPVRRFLGDIVALADSMQEYGLQQPISVR